MHVRRETGLSITRAFGKPPPFLHIFPHWWEGHKTLIAQEILKGQRKSALLVALSIARTYPNTITVPAVAGESGVSISYIEQIAAKLVKARIIKGQRGAGGGYSFFRPPSSTSVLDVIRSVSNTGEIPIASVASIERLEAALNECLRTVTLEQLISGRQV